MTRALPAAALALALAAAALPACKGQDAAVRVTIAGEFLIPSSADQLVLDVLENGQALVRKTWALTAATPLPVSVTFVEGSASHPHIKINATLNKDGRVVGRGNIEADLTGGATNEVTITVLPQ